MMYKLKAALCSEILTKHLVSAMYNFLMLNLPHVK